MSFVTRISIAFAALHIFSATAQTTTATSTLPATGAITSTPIDTSSASTTLLFQYGPVPSSLEASVITRYYEVDKYSSSQSVHSYQIDCVATSSPENDACRALGIYPAIAYHTQGSIFGGTITATAQSATTEWRCAMGGCVGCSQTGARRITTLTGQCNETVVADGSTVTRTTSLDTCHAPQHYVPVLITAGLEKLDQSWYYKSNATAPEYLSALDAQLSVNGCPARPTLTASASTTPTLTSTPEATTTTSTSSSPGSTSPSPGTSSSAGTFLQSGGLAVGIGLLAIHGCLALFR